jgi:hypothetical protein
MAGSTLSISTIAWLEEQMHHLLQNDGGSEHGDV